MMCSSLTVKTDGSCGTLSKTVLNSPIPVTKFCYYCQRTVWTKIKYYPTFKTRILAFGLSFCFLCWVPFAFHWKSELDHHCTFCDCYLGTYNPTFKENAIETLINSLPAERTDEKKQPQKKYREVGRRCGDYAEPLTERAEIIRVYGDALQ